MFKIRMLAAAGLLIALAEAHAAHAVDYSVRKITDNTTYDAMPWINNNRDVVWSGQIPGNNYDVFKYTYATGTTSNISNQFTNSNNQVYTGNSTPQINDQGTITWQGATGSYPYRYSDVFLYNSQTNAVSQLNNSTISSAPQINNQGNVVWGEQWSSTSPSFIKLYDPTQNQVRTISTTTYYYDYNSGGSSINSTYYNPVISNNGDVAFQGINNLRSNYSPNIFVYDSATNSTRNIVNYMSANSADQSINDNGDVAWLNTVSSSKSVELLGGATGAVLHNIDGYPSYQDHTPFVGSNGDVVWLSRSKSNSNTEVYLYDALTRQTTRISDNNPSAMNLSPFLDQWGNVIWEQDIFNDDRIMFYDRKTGVTSTVASGLYMLQDLKINDLGDIVWQANDGFEMEIYLATRNNVQPVPEASTVLLLGAGMGGILLIRQRSKRR